MKLAPVFDIRRITGVVAVMLASSAFAPHETIPACTASCTETSTAGTGVFHLRLERSEPSSGATLSVAPSAIRLWYSLPPEMALTSVKLLSEGGKAIALSSPRRGKGTKDPVEVVIPTELPNGVYTVSWRTASRDGHRITGDFAFTVKRAEH